MNTINTGNSRNEFRCRFKNKFSNLTDLDLRLKINKAEEVLVQLEGKSEKTQEEIEELDNVKGQLKLLLQQSNVPFRLTNTIWFNRPNSIFFSIKEK